MAPANGFLGGLKKDADRMQRGMRQRELASAVSAKDTGKVKGLLAQGYDPNGLIKRSYREPKFIPLLEECIKESQWEMAEALVDAGANPNMIYNNGKTPLKLLNYSFSHEGAVKLFHKLVEKGADIFIGCGEGEKTGTLLHEYAKSKDSLEILKYLLLQGVEPSIKNEEGRTAEELAKPTHSSQRPDREELLRMHRLAPCPKIGKEFISRENLEKKNEYGYSKLDHWHTWDNYENVQMYLSCNGESLKARDLLRSASGQEEEKCLLEKVLQACPSFKSHLFDKQLWQAETIPVARTFFSKLPKDIQENSPYHSLLTTLKRNEISAPGRG